MNSLLAIEEIVEILRTKAKGNTYTVIKLYKGTKTSYASANKCYTLYKNLRKIL